jgi:PAS domain S-box-containing protein
MSKSDMFLPNNQNNTTLSGNLFRYVFNTSAHAIVLFCEHKIVECNAKALSLFNASGNELTGLSFSEILPQSANSETLAHTPDGETTIESQLKKISGETFWAKITIASFQNEGKTYHTVTFEDLTLLKQEQEELNHCRKHFEDLVKEKTAILEERNQQLILLNRNLDTANEELMVNNEELDTTNEELFATNEELELINASLLKEIEEHKKTQAERNILQEKLNQFIFQSSNAISLINDQGIIEQWNQAMCSITGIPDSEAIGQHIWDITAQLSVNSELSDELRNKYKSYTAEFFARLNTEKVLPIEAEHQIRHRDSSIKYINSTLFSIKTPNGNYAGNIIVDITQRKAVEFELEKYRIQLETLLVNNSEKLFQISERFNEIYNNTSEAVTFLDVLDDGTLKVFDMNVAAQRLFGVSPHDITQGVFATDFIPIENYEAFKQNILPTLQRGESVTIKESTEITSGYWQSTITPIKNKNGEVYRITIFSKDISAEYEREKISALLQSAIDSWPFEFWARDNEGRQILQNRVSRERYGNLIGLNVEDSSLYLNYEGSENLIQRALSGEMVSVEGESIIDGQKHYYAYKFSPILSNKKIEGYTCLAIDITDRKIAEEQIRASEARLQKAQTLGHLGYTEQIIGSPDLWCSAEAMSIFGFPPVEGFMEYEKVKPCYADFESFRVAFYELLNNKKKFDIEFAIYPANGAPLKYIHEILIIENDLNDKPYKIIGIFQDITERRQNEEKIKASEAQYRLLAENIDDVIWKMDAKTLRYTFISPSIVKLTGFTVKEAMAQTLEEILMPDSLTEVMEEYEQRKQQFYAGNPDAMVRTYNFKLRHKDGHAVWVEMNTSFIVDNEGKLKEIVASSRNITERVIAEEKIKQQAKLHQTILDTASVGLLYVLNRKIQWVNSAFCKIFGYEYNDVIDKDTLIIYSNLDDYEFVGTEAYKQLSNGEVFLCKDIKGKKKDGTEFWINLNGKAINPANPTAGSVWMLQDNTESKNAEIALKSSESLLKATMESMNDGILVVTGNNINLSNTRFKDMFSVSETQMASSEDEPLLRYVSQQQVEPEEFYNTVKSINETKQSTNHILHLKNGSIIERLSFPLTEDNTSNARVWVFRDITERKKSEDALMKNQKLLSESQRVAHIGCWEYTHDSNVLEWNEETFHIYGLDYSNQPITIETFINLVHPDDRSFVRQQFEKSKIEKDFKEYECRIVRPSGEIRTIYVVGAVTLNEKGDVARSFGIIQDITERQQAEEKIRTSEEQYRLLAENITDVIWKFNVKNQRFTFLSLSAKDLIGYTPEEGLHLSLEQLFAPESLDIIKEEQRIRLRKFLKGNPVAIVKTYEFQLKHKNGHNVWVETISKFVKDAKGNIDIVAVSRNINERKKAEFALRESEERLQVLLSSITDYTYTVAIDCEGNISTKHGEGCRAVTGYDPEDFEKEPYLWLHMVPDEDKQNIISWMHQINHGESVSAIEHRIIQKNGETIWVSNTVVLKKDLNGTLTGYDGLVSNITERKKAENIIKESEERFRNITRLTKHMVYDYNLVTGKIKWDGAVEELTGYTRDEYETVGFNEWASFIHPEERSIVLATFFQSLNNNKPLHSQYRFRNKQNEYIWVEEEFHIVTTPKNKPFKVLGAIKDITEQRRAQSLIIESEEKLRTIFNTSKDGIILINNNLEIIDINNSALSRSAYSRDEIIGANINRLLLNKNIPEVIHRAASMWQEKVMDNFETEMMIKNNGSFPVEISATVIRIDNQDDMLLVIRDISERKQLEKELLHSVINTEERERLHFSQELHDGLGPLLSAAKMYTEWLAEPNANLNAKSIISDIQKLLEESTASIRDISFKLSPHILQNYGIVEALKAYSVKVEKTGKTNIYIQSTNIPRFDDIIETVIYRVVSECINNTVKHARAKNINIEFQIVDNFITVNFTDDGKGFDVNKTISERKGIGLLNMQSRLKSINGQLSIESSIGYGTKFYIKVPLNNS